MYNLLAGYNKYSKGVDRLIDLLKGKHIVDPNTCETSSETHLLAAKDTYKNSIKNPNSIMESLIQHGLNYATMLRNSKRVIEAEPTSWQQIAAIFMAQSTIARGQLTNCFCIVRHAMCIFCLIAMKSKFSRLCDTKMKAKFVLSEAPCQGQGMRRTRESFMLKVISSLHTREPR